MRVTHGDDTQAIISVANFQGIPTACLLECGRYPGRLKYRSAHIHLHLPTSQALDFDYTRRAMPFDFPGTLSADQVYAVVAYVLYLGGIVDEERTLNAATLPAIEMPDRDGFVADPRPDLP